MKVSYQWLNDYVDLSGTTAGELAERLTRSGVETDGVESRDKGISGVVVGYVQAKEKHPDADKLNVCTVDAGQGELLQIVCGAANVAAGQKVPVALVGAVLPDNFKIKKAKLRGVESYGMICSAKELGMNEKMLPKELQEGILVLPADTEIGTDIREVLGLADEVLDLDLTPNRSDCLSMIGTAYEIAAILGREVSLPHPERDLRETAKQAGSEISVAIDSENCSFYAARLIEGVRIGMSPLWLQNRLLAAGIRPINNVVDITNYVMLEYGQPLHAFDADALNGGRIEVRQARSGEKLTTLDGTERALDPEMLLIASGGEPVGLAGVMGGANSEVTPGTTRILLESARFSGASVRKTSRRLGLRSEASQRFEKEVDPAAVIPALNRAASLIAQYGGGSVARGIVEARTAEDPQPAAIALPADKVNRYLGTSLEPAEMREILTRLHLDTSLDSANGDHGEGGGAILRVQVPTRRGDIVRDVDLIEEIARLYGYDNIPATPISGVTTPGHLSRNQRIRRMLRTLLTGCGMHEVVNYSLAHPDQLAATAALFETAAPVRLAMPMSEERSVLRTSLLPHLIEVASYNRNRGNEDIAVFELGTAFVSGERELTRLPEEHHVLGLVLAGRVHAPHWASPQPREADFYDMKGIVERLADALGLGAIRFVPATAAGFHPGRTADVLLVGRDGSERRLGRMGQLHPQLQASRDLGPSYAAELELEAIYGAADFEVAFRSLPRYPAVTRDLALVVDRGLPVEGLTRCIRTAAGELLESLQIFDIYTGERVEAGKKSVALSLTLRRADRTLTDEEAADLLAAVTDALGRECGAVLRS